MRCVVDGRLVEVGAADVAADCVQKTIPGIVRQKEGGERAILRIFLRLCHPCVERGGGALESLRLLGREAKVLKLHVPGGRRPVDMKAEFLGNGEPGVSLSAVQPSAAK